MGVDRINEIIRNHNVEFLDFGCSTGGSINRFSSMIKGSPVGLGLDIDPLKVATTRSAGYLAEVCDITELADQGIKVRFVSMSHFLEHIPDPGAIARILKVACRIARDFIIIVQPNFDSDAYLFRNGKKFY
jgi:2-polyprenyl-3-methyl-5-hydroxy-6-metoxy-1,4-benzoquinol methylase